MRCPGCGSDTTPALPRCTRCNTPLDRPGEEATRRDPNEGRPVPPPWSAPPQDPPGWNPPPRETPSWNPPPPPPAGPGETSISLSPEPWDEPAIWQPPAPQKPRRDIKPYLLVIVGAIALAAIAVLIVVWPSGKDDPGRNTGASQPDTSQSPTTTSDEPTPTDDETTTPASGGAAEQARSVDSLLSEMASSRAQLGPIAESCDTSGLRRIVGERQSQLEKARSLEVGELTSGAEMRSALVRALQASVDAGQARISGGCSGNSTATAADSRASSAKSEFVGYWNAIASENNLPARKESEI